MKKKESIPSAQPQQRTDDPAPSAAFAWSMSSASVPANQPIKQTNCQPTNQQPTNPKAGQNTSSGGTTTINDFHRSHNSSVGRRSRGDIPREPYGEQRLPVVDLRTAEMVRRADGVGRLQRRHRRS